VKALRNFTHNGVSFKPGDLLPHSLVTPEDVKAAVADATAGLPQTQFPVSAQALSALADKMTQDEHDALVEAGVITYNDSEPLPTAMDVKLFNYQVQEGDDIAERERKVEQAQNRAANVATNVSAPQPAPSQVAQGTPADAQAAIDKANAADQQSSAAPTTEGAQ
jgi:hypothetical protein